MKKLIHLALSAFILCIVTTGCAVMSPPPPPPTVEQCGPQPVVDKPSFESQLRAGLKDPESARFEWEPLRPVAFPLNGKWVNGWSAKVWVNAKNSFGGYAGPQPYWFRYKDGVMVQFLPNWAVAKIDWKQP